MDVSAFRLCAATSFDAVIVAASAPVAMRKRDSFTRFHPMQEDDCDASSSKCFGLIKD
jgi:hypothetical protein